MGGLELFGLVTVRSIKYNISVRLHATIQENINQPRTIPKQVGS